MVDRDRLIEHVTSLLIHKVQFDNQFEIIQRVVENENWNQGDQLKKSIERGERILDRMRKEFNKINNISYY